MDAVREICEWMQKNSKNQFSNYYLSSI